MRRRAPWDCPRRPPVLLWTTSPSPLIGCPTASGSSSYKEPVEPHHPRTPLPNAGERPMRRLMLLSAAALVLGAASLPAQSEDIRADEKMLKDAFQEVDGKSLIAFLRT